ncbi:MAG: hypothetical protein GY822_01735 [Deltaproteobacteria bacterium]|nr:hypothetical protein [Deltaproteobacteria bacterium]
MKKDSAFSCFTFSFLRRVRIKNAVLLFWTALVLTSLSVFAQPVKTPNVAGNGTRISGADQSSNLTLENRTASLAPLHLPMPAHLLFVPEVTKGDEGPILLLSWQPAKKGAYAHVAARVLQEGQVVGRHYSYSRQKSPKKRTSATRKDRRGLLGALPVDVHVTLDGERGRVYTFAKMGEWQTTDSARRQAMDEPVVVEPNTLRLWIRDAVTLEQGKPVVVKASLHGTRTSVKGKVVAVGAVLDDSALLLDEQGNPVVATSSLEKIAFFVDTAAACGVVVPRAMVLPWDGPSGIVPEDGLQYLRLLSTQTTACDDVTAVVRLRGRFLQAGNEVKVRGIWLQHLPRAR